MNEKERLVEQCITLLGWNSDPDTQQRGRAYYNNFDVAYLRSEVERLTGTEEAEQARVNANRAQQLWIIFKESGLENTPANEALLEQMMPGETLSLELFQSLLKSNPKMASRFSWTSKPFQAAAQKREEVSQADREAFTQAMRELVCSPNEANFSLVRGSLGSGYSVFDIKAAVQSGQIQLAAATAAEMQKYHQDAVQTYQDMLKNLAAKGDVQTLRYFARQEAEINRRNAINSQGQISLETMKERDSHRNYPLLPESISRFNIASASSEYLRTLLQKYGQYQLTRRLLQTAGE